MTKSPGKVLVNIYGLLTDETADMLGSPGSAACQPAFASRIMFAAQPRGQKSEISFSSCQRSSHQSNRHFSSTFINRAAERYGLYNSTIFGSISTPLTVNSADIPVRKAQKFASSLKIQDFDTFSTYLDPGFFTIACKRAVCRLSEQRSDAILSILSRSIVTKFRINRRGVTFTA
jgi:hypothetical protein